jgi:hypothetical protein
VEIVGHNSPCLQPLPGPGWINWSCLYKWCSTPSSATELRLGRLTELFSKDIFLRSTVGDAKDNRMSDNNLENDGI